jgi:hypothetical protein
MLKPTLIGSAARTVAVVQIDSARATSSADNPGHATRFAMFDIE